MYAQLLFTLAVVIGPPASVQGGDKPSIYDEAPIKTFLAHCAKHGVVVQHLESGWWLVEKGDGYEVVVHLRGYAATVTEPQMRADVMKVNLALMLNAPARLAMSHTSLRLSDLKKKPANPSAAGQKLEKLFKDYRPPESKPAPKPD